jgi:nucleotide-binding universal stress UspA family protein
MPNYLVALDESQSARSAFNLALSMIHKNEDELFLLNVREPAPLPVPIALGGMGGFGGMMEGSFAAEEKQRAQRSRAILIHFGKKAKEAGLKYHLLTIVSAEAAEAICDVVDQKSIDMLIMGRRGIGAVKRFFLGSVSDYCVKNAHCNVVLAKEDFGPPEVHSTKLEAVVQEEAERDRRMAEDKRHVLESKRVSNLNREITAIAEEEERRLRLHQDAYNEQMRQNAQATAQMIANATSLNQAPDEHVIEMIHKHKI